MFVFVTSAICRLMIVLLPTVAFITWDIGGGRSDPCDGSIPSAQLEICYSGWNDEKCQKHPNVDDCKSYTGLANIKQVNKTCQKPHTGPMSKRCKVKELKCADKVKCVWAGGNCSPGAPILDGEGNPIFLNSNQAVDTTCVVAEPV